MWFKSTFQKILILTQQMNIPSVLIIVSQDRVDDIMTLACPETVTERGRTTPFHCRSRCLETDACPGCPIH